jgi:hypothetical protein
MPFLGNFGIKTQHSGNEFDHSKVIMTDRGFRRPFGSGTFDMTKLLSQAALLLNKTYRLLSAGSLPPEYPPLLNLPPELIGMIFEGEVLTNDDLGTLRLTCKHTKYFASDILARRHFIDIDAYYSHYGSGWFAHILSSDLGSHARSLSLIEPDWWHRSGHYAPTKGNTKPDYSRLQYLRVTYCRGAIDSWKKVLRAAVHLKILKVQPSTSSRVGYQVPYWVLVYRFMFDHNDELLSSIRSDSLTEVVLAGLHLSASALKQLLTYHSKTISAVDIKCCLLVDGTWLETLNWIGSNLPNLQSLRADVRHEAVDHEQQHTIRTSIAHQHRGKPPLTILTHEIPIVLALEGRGFIDYGLWELLHVRKSARVDPSKQLIRL